MGVSVSWHKDEYDALGVPFHQRGQILDDQLRACRVLWTQAPASFHSQTVNFDGMYCSPRPAPGERIPIMFGGHYTPKLIRRIAELGDGWLLYGGLRMNLDERRAAIAAIRRAVEEAGRAPGELEFAEEVPPIDGSVERSVEQIPALAEIGVTRVRMHLRRFAQGPDDVLRALEEIARRCEPFRAIVV
jgi:alkanesulfonate monooxygenase SsuD/methylene tetrahydromethanopterin reductase-like flavin-dependent oxidoreductase (luciferase family)